MVSVRPWCRALVCTTAIFSTAGGCGTGRSETAPASADRAPDGRPAAPTVPTLAASSMSQRSATAPSKCLERYRVDEFSPKARGGDPDWYERGAQRISRRVQERLDRRFGDRRLAQLQAGYHTVGIDEAGSRLVVLIDSKLIDPHALNRELNQLARRVYRAAQARGARVVVQVAESCFTSKTLLRVREDVLGSLNAHDRAAEAAGQHHPGGPVLYGVDIDSRLHLLLPERYRSTGHALERRHGPRIAITYGPGAVPLGPDPETRPVT